MPHSRRRACLAMLVVVLAASLLVRAWSAAHTEFPGVDDVFYLEQARALVADHVLPFCSFPPGLPLVIAVPLGLLDIQDPTAPLRAAQGVNVVFGVLMAALTYLAVARRSGGWAGLGAAVVMSVLPQSLALSDGALSGLLHACCLLGAWLCLERRRMLAAGLLLGYAYLVRPEALVVIAAVAVFLAARERRAPWRFVAGALVPVVPYLLFARVSLGYWSPSGKAGFLAAAVAEAEAGGLGTILRTNLPAHAGFLPALVGWPVTVLAVVGACARPGRWLLLLLPLLVFPVFTFRMDARYWIPYLPLVLLAATLGGAWLVQWLRPWPPRATAAVLVALALVGVGVGAVQDVDRIRRQHEAFVGLRDAGLWLRDRVERDTVVAAYKPYASHWAWCRFVNYGRAASAEEIVRGSIDRGAGYVVVNRFVHRFFLPALEPLTHPLPPDLAALVTPVKVFEYPEFPGHDTIVFRVNEPQPADPNPRRTFWTPWKPVSAGAP